jgi:hypothetical protein
MRPVAALLGNAKQRGAFAQSRGGDLARAAVGLGQAA